ncbi:hypothetical protein NIES23_37610 [Trichormus variabilis NIES-23]|uniref:Uncharacterized protein n=1 Tax=Trichormus variabilis NIES-23 TaxID=1973479 RepID=A0A1Z4KPR9_ANAVA|nr:hypothetical protein NIES23_37610 [Trichormus variabilis NIES-23]
MTEFLRIAIAVGQAKCFFETPHYTYWSFNPVNLEGIGI